MNGDTLLRKLIVYYTQHRPECEKVRQNIEDPEVPCTCGLSNLIRELVYTNKREHLKGVENNE